MTLPSCFLKRRGPLFVEHRAPHGKGIIRDPEPPSAVYVVALLFKALPRQKTLPAVTNVDVEVEDLSVSGCPVTDFDSLTSNINFELIVPYMLSMLYKFSQKIFFMQLIFFYIILLIIDINYVN